jgi:bifunctional non-homologous end joining protein LigD
VLLLPRGWSLVYYAFGLLHLNGEDLKDRPLKERRALLQKVHGKSGVLFSQSLPGTLSQIMDAVQAHGLEGVIAKRLDSKYHPDRRGDDWLKLPLKPSQHFVIGAYRLDGKRLELFLVGQFEGSKLLFAGKVHQGLNPANLPTVKSGQWREGVPAAEMSDYTWLRPEIEAEIKFAEGTTGSLLRHAEFVTVRQL